MHFALTHLGLLVTLTRFSDADYFSDRDALLDAEDASFLGGDEQLNSQVRVNINMWYVFHLN